MKNTTPAAAAKKKKKKKAGNVLFYLFLIGFILCALMIGAHLLGAYNEKKSYDTLAQITKTPVGESPFQDAGEPEDPTHRKQFDQLLELNPDFYGWLNVPGTNINYPVMFTPKEPGHYLRRNFFDQWAMGGVPFLNAGCASNGNSFIIHGHNMNNGTMFADLMNYTDEDYYFDHPILLFDMQEGGGQFQIMAAFYYDVTEKPGMFHLYEQVGRLDHQHLDAYIQFIEENALYDTGVDAEYGDTLVALSTCSEIGKNGRFVVVARQQGKHLPKR